MLNACLGEKLVEKKFAEDAAAMEKANKQYNGGIKETTCTVLMSQLQSEDESIYEPVDMV